MGIHHILKDPHFNIIFSILVGVGFICMVRPQCKGNECTVNKPPTEEDFDKYVYRMEGGKCYEFKTEIVKCPASGAVEAFSRYPVPVDVIDHTRGQFASRGSIF